MPKRKTIEELIDEVTQILADDSRHLAEAARAGELTAGDRMSLAAYLRALVGAAKDARDAELGRDLTKLTDDELRKMVEKELGGKPLA